MKTNYFGTFLETVREGESKKNKKWILMVSQNGYFLPEAFSISEKRLEAYILQKLKKTYNKEILIMEDINLKKSFVVDDIVCAYIMEIQEV